MKKVGVPPHLLGYEYLGYAIEIVTEDRKLIHLVTKQLYPSIAKKFSTTPSRVERAIRNAIEVSFNNITLVANCIEDVFGNTISYAKGKPTNSHFIAAMVEMIENDNDKGEER